MTQPSLFDPAPDAPAEPDEPTIDEHGVADPEVIDLRDGAITPAPVRPKLPVRVVRSKNRRKTVDARIVEGVIEVRVPARMSKKDESVYVAELVARLEKREFEKAVDVDQRARMLAKRYELPLPASIRFVDNQSSRWGSCSIETREIRLSSRLANYPTWVLDYVIVHELAHLVVAGHDAKFHALVARFPHAERARGYLHAKADGVA